MKNHLVLLPVLMILMLLALAPAVQAQDTLTEDTIRTFYKEAAEIYDREYEKYALTLENMIHENYEGIVSGTLELPNSPPQAFSEKTDKKSMLQNRYQDYQAMQNATIEDELTTIEIAKDGQSAFIAEKTRIRGMAMPVSFNTGIIKVNVHATCNDVVVIGENAMIQVLKSDCEMDITIHEEREL